MISFSGRIIYIFQTYKKNVSKFWANKGSWFCLPLSQSLAATYTGSSGGQNPLFLMAEGISDGQGKWTLSLPDFYISLLNLPRYNVNDIYLLCMGFSLCSSIYAQFIKPCPASVSPSIIRKQSKLSRKKQAPAANANISSAVNLSEFKSTWFWEPAPCWHSRISSKRSFIYPIFVSLYSTRKVLFLF